MAQPLNERLAVADAGRLAALAGQPDDTAPGRPDAGWHRLAEHALVPAAGAGPEWLGTLLDYLGRDAYPLIARHRGGAMTGLMAVTVKGLAAGYPATVAATWHTPLTFAGTPLVARENADQAIAALLVEAKQQTGACAVLMAGMEADPSLLAAIETAAVRLGVSWRRLGSHRRAALKTGAATYEAWLETGLAAKKRKEFRRLKVRLGEVGQLSFESLGKGERAGRWVEEFLALERAGWKGRRGTAIACDEALSEALRAALAKLAGRGDLGFWKLSLDRRPIAMLFAAMAGERAWLVKIAHDESLQRFSPGVLMVLEATRDLFAGGRVNLVDSCAMPGHPLIDHLWRDRIEITDVMIATPGTPDWLFGLIAAAERLRRGLRTVAKRTFNALTGRRVK